MIEIIFKGEYCDLNSYIKALNYNRFMGASIKQRETQRAFYECKERPRQAVKKYPVEVCFKWYSKDNKKDIDNVCFAKKYILDGLVLAHVIENDSRKFVKKLSDEFFIDKENPRVVVKIKSI